MSNDALLLDVETYAAAVRGALADLPSAEQTLMLEDLDEHLAEVASEGDGWLIEKLGPPEAYAAELRAAYRASIGLPSSRIGAFLRPVEGAAAKVRANSWYRAVRAFLPDLRPAWWVLRAYLLVLGLAEIEAGGQSVGAFPDLATRHGLVQALLTAFAIVVSVRIGRRSFRVGSGWRALAIAANAALGVFGLVALGSLSTGSPLEASGPYSPPYPVQVFAQGDVTNIYPFAADGTLLHGVLLYDQNGQPVILPGSKGNGVLTQLPQDAQGQPITNEYPLKQTYPDGQPVPPPSVAVPQQPAPPTPSPTPRPSASP